MAKLIGKYELHEAVGKGGFGTVYRATDRALEKVVALKVLHPYLTGDPAATERFEQEARTAAQLDHPNIVPVYDVGQEGEAHYIAMKYLPGGSLADRITRGPLPFADALAVLRDACAGLQLAHRKGLIHRDLKPANLLFDADGRAVITDFGLAKALNTTSSGLSSSQGGVGTPFYRAPELWRGEPPPSPASDVYALGCILYEMLAGRMLFSGPTPEVVMFKHLSGEPGFGDVFSREGIPAGLKDVIEKSLARDPNLRYPSAQDFLRAVDHAAQFELERKSKAVESRNRREEEIRLQAESRKAEREAQTQFPIRAGMPENKPVANPFLPLQAYDPAVGRQPKEGPAGERKSKPGRSDRSSINAWFTQPVRLFSIVFVFIVLMVIGITQVPSLLAGEPTGQGTYTPVPSSGTLTLGMGRLFLETFVDGKLTPVWMMQDTGYQIMDGSVVQAPGSRARYSLKTNASRASMNIVQDSNSRIKIKGFDVRHNSERVIEISLLDQGRLLVRGTGLLVTEEVPPYTYSAYVGSTNDDSYGEIGITFDLKNDVFIVDCLYKQIVNHSCKISAANSTVSIAQGYRGVIKDGLISSEIRQADYDAWLNWPEANGQFIDLFPTPVPTSTGSASMTTETPFDPQATILPSPTGETYWFEAFPTPVRPETYTLMAGEPPFCIPRRYNLDLSGFLSINGLSLDSKVPVGTVLKIPAEGEWSIDRYGPRALRSHPAKWTVAEGDSINGIACDYGDVYPEAILYANGLSSPSDIKPGMELIIP